MMLFLLIRFPFAFLASTSVNVLAADPTGGWIELVKPFGVAAPFALLCLFGAKELWQENKRLLALLLEATPILAESNKLVSEATATLTTVTVMMHSFQGRPALDPGELLIVKRLLEAWQRNQDRLADDRVEDAARGRRRPRTSTTADEETT